MAFPDSTTRPPNEIVVQASPRGVMLEGTFAATGGTKTRPGMAVQLKAGAAAVNGRPVYEPYNRAADGARAAVLIVLANLLQGQALATQDFVTDLDDIGGVDAEFDDEDHIYLYAPAMGEEILVRVATPGTGSDDAVAVGDELMIDDGTGFFIAAAGPPAAVPFQALEAVPETVATGTLVRAMFTGCT